MKQDAFQRYRRLLVKRGGTLLAFVAMAVTYPVPATAALLAEYDSGVGVPQSPTTQGWTASQVIEAGNPSPTLATAIDETGNTSLANAGAGATGWIVRDYLDGAADGLDDRPEYNMALTDGDFSGMSATGWTFTTSFAMDNVTEFGQEMRLLSIDQGGGSGLPFDIKVNASYVGNVQGGNLGLVLAGGGGEIDTGVPAEQFNTVVIADIDGDGSFTFEVNGNLLSGGATFTTNPSGGDVPGDNVIVFGGNSTGGDGGGIEIDFLRLETGDVASIASLTIDRVTGNLSLANNTGAAKSIVGYKIVSPEGALNSGVWQSISDNYDASGNGSIDGNDQWIELTAVGGRTDLSEFEPDGDGGSFADGQTIDLGNAWIKNPNEDSLEAELLLIDGTVEFVNVVFTGGPNNGAYEFGDLDFDGDFDVDDFTGEFVPGFGADTSSLSDVEQYQAGDFNNDDVVDEIDFLIYNEAFLAANPGSAALSLTGVPEPTTAMLLGLAGLPLLLRRSRASGARKLLPTAGAVCLLVALQASNAQAQPSLLAHWSFDETSGTTLVDSTGGNNGTAQGALTGSANAGQIGNAWNFAGGFLEVANPTDFTGLDADYSFSMWVNTTDGLGVMWSISDSTVGSEEVAVRVNDNSDEGTVGGAHYMGRPNVSKAVSAQPINDAQWHHVVATQSPTGWEMYVDGALEAAGTDVHSPLLIGADTARIGVNTDSGSIANGQWNYDGLLDDMSIWDGPLSAAEVGELYLKGLAGIPAPDPFDAVLSIQADRSNGEILLQNNSGVAYEIDLYRISSDGNSLDPGGWNSLDDQNFDASAWTELGQTVDKASEGAFGDSTVLADGFSQSLGNLYNEFVNAEDLVFEFHIPGTPPSVLIEGDVTYINEPPTGGDPDVDNDLDVDGRDLLLLGRGFPATSSAADFAAWNLQFGNGAGAGGGAAAVPEPTALALLLIPAVGLSCVLRRRAAKPGSLALALAALLATLSALSTGSQAAVTNDRDYQLGDDSAESAIAGNTVGSNVGGVTFDSAGQVGTGNLQDLAVNGNPTYVSVSDRPGASGGDLGAAFDGAGDSLITTISMNDPSDMWDSDAFFPSGSEFPQNYETITAHGMQLWAKPDLGALGQGARQGLIFDTFEHGILITPNDTWGLWYDPDDGGLGTNPEIDSGVTVASTTDDNGWVHLMQIAGAEEPVEGGSDDDGALLVNGVAVAAKAGAYDDDASELVVGASLDQDNLGQVKDHYTGVLDDVRLFLWGDNSEQDNNDGRVGQNWGTLNLAEDNDWIAQQLQTLGVTDPADVNLDGNVSGDGTGPAATDDVTKFVEGWQSTRVVNDVQVGDWISRQAGDLNYDGIVDIDDAFALRTGLINSGGGSFDLSLVLGTSVPEPEAWLLALLSGAPVMGRRRAI